MLEAAAQRKRLSAKPYEDEITSMVFGPWSYMPPKESWPYLLAFLGKPDPLATLKPADLRVDLWPRRKIIYRDVRCQVEPDALITVTSTDGCEIQVIIEIKWAPSGERGAPLSSKDPDNLHDQLSRQWCTFGGNNTWHLFITTEPSCSEIEECGVSLRRATQSENEVNEWSERFRHITWETVSGLCAEQRCPDSSKTGGGWAINVSRALERFGIHKFRGFSRIEKPAVEINNFQAGTIWSLFSCSRGFMHNVAGLYVLPEQSVILMEGVINMSINSSIGAQIFQAANLVEAAYSEVRALQHQLERMLLEASPSDERIRNIAAYNSHYLYGESGEFLRGVLSNYAVRISNEKEKSEPRRCLTVFTQLSPCYEEADDEPLLVHEALLHVLYSNAGPWDDNAPNPVVLTSNWMQGDGWDLIGNALWGYEGGGEIDWCFSVPLGEIHDIKKIKREIIRPIENLLADVEELPGEEKSQASFANSNGVVRFEQDRDGIRVTSPKRLVESG